MKNILFLVFFSILIIFNYSIQAETNTVSSTVVTSTPSTANAPSVVVNNSDVCKSASSGSVQTQVFGIASGITITDENCERIKLARSLYSMGMKVASVSLLSQDYRVFDAMWSAGTYPPINGKIGIEAKEEWLLNKHLIPEGSFLLDEKEIVEVKEGNDEFGKFLFYGMALYTGVTVFGIPFIF
tara:strand:+ start:31 stop:582 length:552 start_codon:yes stop_codon:yes gene_type:complete